MKLIDKGKSLDGSPYLCPIVNVFFGQKWFTLEQPFHHNQEYKLLDILEYDPKEYLDWKLLHKKDRLPE